MFSNVPSSEGPGQMEISFERRDDWELFAEKLGLTPAEIRFLDKRTRNQVLEVLIFASQKYLITVGDLYDVLKDCGLPAIADFL
ncbi:hypothetical protein pdam_00024887 [Pocillopora damicornis]|uniref:Death domain-containing protein n=1 Tax=Pocillopora damicornis TaxID=46731 RepID=A0A3M6UYF5_POCDA|nr:hypothetical protein pdam_00024887 [Pocillopora damicornis]